METLDNILSREGEATPSTDTVTQAQPSDQTTEQKPEADDVETVDVGGRKLVPHEALHAEKQKGKRYTEQVAEFSQTVSGLREQNDALQRQVGELLTRLPKNEQQTVKRDWFEDPDGAALQVVQPHLERLQGTLMHNSRLVADSLYTSEKVTAAEEAFGKAVKSRQLDPADFDKVINSPNVYATAVQWHQRQQVLADVGDDPAAYRERLKTELLAEINAANGNGNGAATNGAAGSPSTVMPSNFAGARNVGSRSGTAWGGPSAMQDIFARHRAKT